VSAVRKAFSSTNSYDELFPFVGKFDVSTTHAPETPDSRSILYARTPVSSSLTQRIITYDPLLYAVGLPLITSAFKKPAAKTARKNADMKRRFIGLKIDRKRIKVKCETLAGDID
jgi:hypothetical protein